MDIKILKEKFLKEFGGSSSGISCFFSPGRVNLIGEHIDYNGGCVFPGALTMGIYAAVRYNGGREITMRSGNVGERVTVEIDKPIVKCSRDGWGNYPKGVIKALLDNGVRLKGCEIYFEGDLPDGAGLSSSAALEVLTGYMLQYNGRDDIDRVELSKLSQNVENNFVGVNCGIMDQFSVAMGKKDNAILLDCNTLEYKYVPFVLGSYRLVVMNTKKKRELADSKYNERRSECDAALAKINETRHINNLCEASEDDINLLNGILKKRARHAASENKRVYEAEKVLKNGDIKRFGELMTASHKSLKEDYEVTGFELDTIVSEALKVDGCIGARMTGAGFGGCAIAIVDGLKLEKFKKSVYDGYNKLTGLKPEFYVSVIGDGVKFIG